jgi:DNA-binding SARP family transcriptional activator
MGQELTIQLLGPVELRVRERTLPLPGDRQARVLAALAVDVGRVVTFDHLIDVVWPIDPPGTARRQVQDLVSRMRAQLAKAGCAQQLVATHAAGYSLEVASEAIDATRFRAQVSLAGGLRVGDPAQAAATLKAALQLWRGDALGGLAGGPLDAPRFGLDELRVQAWEDRIELETELGRHLDVLPELGQLILSHPFHERLVYLHMIGLGRAGRTADAVQAFQRLRKRLRDELGLSPGPEVQLLYESLVRNESPRLAAAGRIR